MVKSTSSLDGQRADAKAPARRTGKRWPGAFGMIQCRVAHSYRCLLCGTKRQFAAVAGMSTIVCVSKAFSRAIVAFNLCMPSKRSMRSREAIKVPGAISQLIREVREIDGLMG